MQLIRKCVRFGAWLGFGFLVFAAVSWPWRPPGSVPSASLRFLYNKTSETLKTGLSLLALCEPGPGLPKCGIRWWLCQDRAPDASWVQVKSHLPVHPPPRVSVDDGASLASILPSVKEDNKGGNT